MYSSGNMSCEIYMQMSARSRSLFTSGLINCIAISPFTLTLSKVNKKMSKIYPHGP